MADGGREGGRVLNKEEKIRAKPISSNKKHERLTKAHYTLCSTVTVYKLFLPTINDLTYTKRTHTHSFRSFPFESNIPSILLLLYLFSLGEYTYITYI